VAQATREHLDPAAAGPPALRPVPAPVPLAQAEQEGPAVAVGAGEALQPLVEAVQGELEPGAAQVAEAFVVLLDLGHEALAAGPGLDQDVEAAGGRVVGDVLEAVAAAAGLADQAGAVRRCQRGRDAGDVGCVVEDHVAAAVAGQDAAGLEPAARVREQGGELGLPRQDQPPLHGRGS